MKLFFILGNQLFPLKYVDRFKKDHSFYMAEDYGLCTYEKHHKQKILLFLSSMRSYADNLKKNKFKLDYIKIEDKEFKDDYLKFKPYLIENEFRQIRVNITPGWRNKDGKLGEPRITFTDIQILQDVLEKQAKKLIYQIQKFKMKKLNVSFLK